MTRGLVTAAAPPMLIWGNIAHKWRQSKRKRCSFANRQTFAAGSRLDCPSASLSAACICR
jgi:hypothetical protein